MTKILTPHEIDELENKRKEQEISLRSNDFNLAVSRVVELVSNSFEGRNCLVKLKIVNKGTNKTYNERDPEVIKVAIEILQKDFEEAGWVVSLGYRINVLPFIPSVIAVMSVMRGWKYFHSLVPAKADSSV